jgi:hypothetical protein
LFAVALLPVRAWAQLPTISGTVTNARTGLGIPNVAVQIYAPGMPSWEGVVTSAVTGPNGVYVATLPGQGTYRAGTLLGPYKAERYNNVECRRVCMPYAGEVIAVSAGETRGGVDFSLHPTGAADIVADFGPVHGLWMLGANNQWQQLHPLTSLAMISGDFDGNHHDDLAVNFGPNVGVYAWMNHTTWRFVHSLSPTRIVAGDLDNNGRDDLVFVFPGLGVWRWVDTDAWNQIHSLDPGRLAAGFNEIEPRGSELILDFAGLGLWTYGHGSGWRQIHPFNTTTLLAPTMTDRHTLCCISPGGYDVVAGFAGLGLWAFRDGMYWRQQHAVTPRLTAAGFLDTDESADLVIDYGAPYGIWRSNTQIHPLSADSIVLADRTSNGIDEIIIDFGPGIGLWVLTDLTAWSHLHGLSPVAVVAGHFH